MAVYTREYSWVSHGFFWQGQVEQVSQFNTTNFQFCTHWIGEVLWKWVISPPLLLIAFSSLHLLSTWRTLANLFTKTPRSHFCNGNERLREMYMDALGWGTSGCPGTTQDGLCWVPVPTRFPTPYIAEKYCKSRRKVWFPSLSFIRCVIPVIRSA